MPFIQKYQNKSSVSQLYTTGLHQTLLVVGLGNPGKECVLTRHNLGFMCTEHFATNQDFPDWINKKDFQCEFTQSTIGQHRIILIKPTTFMNNSGEAVHKVSQFYRIAPDQILAIYDELDIDFGQIRTRTGGGDAGHNGVKSLITHLGQNFKRVRIGIGPKQPTEIDSADYVLQALTKTQQSQLPTLFKEVSSVVSEFAFSGGQLNTDTRSFLV